MRPFGFDTETYQIGPEALAPKLVCGSFAQRDPEGTLQAVLLGNHPDDGLKEAIAGMLVDPELLIVTQSGGYDYCVVCANYPDLIPLVFEALLSGRCTDTEWREKLLNLSTQGRLERIRLPDGSTKDIGYGQADLEANYLGRDRSQEKDDLEESWRTAYSALDGWKAEDYPEDASEYALDDARGNVEVYEAQEQRKADFPIASTTTEHFQIAAQFALRLMTIHGMEKNPEEVEKLRAEVQRVLGEVEGGLVQAGLLRPAIPPAPHKRQVEKAQKLLQEGDWGIVPGEVDWPASFAAAREFLESQGIKFTAGHKATVNEAAVQAHVEALYKRLGEIPTQTPTGAICVDAEVQERLAMHDPVMELYAKKQGIKKMADQLVIFDSGPIIYPNYNALVETGRTSSYGSSKKRKALYPSCNIQNVPKARDELDPRRCYRPREGTVFFDVDITGLELACVAQVTHDLFVAGEIAVDSQHLALYNAGVDLHGYLASDIQAQLGSDGVGREFQQACRSEGILGDRMAVYEAFLECKGHTEEPVRKWFKASRNLAKPIGLGLPGGQGPETMAHIAWRDYGVVMSVEEATNFRVVWRGTYPEMPLFFDWIAGQRDEYNDGDGEDLYWYETPLGMIRRGATYCSMANGKCMQSPGAEVAKAWVIVVQRECWDPTQRSVLLGARPCAFIHDQIVGETTRDQSLWHDQAMRVRQVLVETSASILPDVRIRSDEAHLTTVWSKDSVPTFDADKRLIPWRPEVKK